jgi:hypothetical protein
MKRLATSVVILMSVASVALLGVIHYLQNTSAPEWAYRCQEMGSRFVNEMRKRDRGAGMPLAKLAYTHRLHYNFEKHKCLVRTDIRTVAADGVKSISISQIWDVAAGVGALPYAGESRSFSGFDDLIVYQDAPDRPKDMHFEEWFNSLMTQ